MNEHPIWQDFKHLNLDINTALIWPEGAGGHFLANYRNSDIDIDIQENNEYTIKSENFTYPWFLMDIWGNEYTASSKLNDAYDVAKLRHNPPCFENMHDLVLGHYLPTLTSKIFNLSINELIYIDLQREWAWLPMTLGHIKNKFLSYPYRFVIGNILSYYDSIVKTSTSEFNSNLFYSVMNPDSLLIADIKTKEIRKDLIDYKSPYMWEYTIWARSSKVPINEKTFKDFSSVMFGNTAVETYYNKIDLNQKSFKLSNANVNITRIDYIDLFFKGDISKLSSFKGINNNVVLEYSKNNLELLKKMYTILHDEEVNFIKSKIKILENYLKEDTGD